MSKERFNEIFLKDYITINELGELLGLSYQQSAKKMRDIKRRNDRLGILGKLHVQDYFDFFGVTDMRRYCGEIGVDNGTQRE